MALYVWSQGTLIVSILFVFHRRGICLQVHIWLSSQTVEFTSKHKELKKEMKKKKNSSYLDISENAWVIDISVLIPRNMFTQN